MKKRWELKTLGDVVTFRRGLTYSKKDEVDFSSNIVLRANNIDFKTNRLDFSELKYINDDITIPKEKKVSKGSLIICTASGSKSHLGKIALIDDNYDYAFGGFMGQLNPSNEIDSRYLFYLLTSNEYKTFINRLSDGVNINNLRFDNLSKFPILLPPFPEQKRIVKILDEVFENVTKVKENAENNLQNARELFESYLQSIFANLSDKWEVKKLGEACDIYQPKTISKKEMIENGKYPVFGANGIIGKYDKFNHENSELLITCRGATCGSVNISIPKSWINGNAMIIRPKNKKNLSSNFLKYFFIGVDLSNIITGAAQPQITRQTLAPFEIPLPSIEEQKRIVERLDALSEEVKKLEQAYQQKLDNLEELKKSILKQAFSGELAGTQ